MVIDKRAKRRTTIYKALHKTLNLEQEEYEDIKGAIRIRISKKNRQHNKTRGELR